MPRQRKGSLEEQQQRDLSTKRRSFLRRASLKWPERTKAKYAARRPYIGLNKKQKWEYQCNICKQWMKWDGPKGAKNMVMDHIVPCGTSLHDEDYKTFIPNLLCLAENFQALCKECHNSIKTTDDRKRGWK